MPRRRDLGDIDGGEDRRAADRQPAYEAEDEERCPARRERAAESRDEIKDGEHAQAVAAAKGVAGLAREQGADQRSPQRGRNGEDRKSVVKGKSVTVRVQRGGHRRMKKKKDT